MAKKAGTAKPKKAANTRAKETAVGEKSKKKQEGHLVEDSSVSEKKSRSPLSFFKKDRGSGEQEKRVSRKQRQVAQAKERTKVGFFKGISKYFQGVWGELKKVYWPTRKELVGYTGVVIATVVVVSAMIWIADVVLSKLLSLLLTVRL